MRKPSWWRRSLLMIIVVGLVMCGFGAVALAGDSDEEALDTVRQANAYYDNGEFHDAVSLYRRAYDHLGDERLLYRIGLSYENMGNYSRARQFLEKYLEEDADSPVRGRVEASIRQSTELEKAIQAYLDIETEPAGADVYFHGYLGEPEATAPAKIPVAAGVTTVTLVFPEGQRLEVNVEVGAGETVERFFQIGTGTAATVRDGEGVELASEEMAAVEHPEEEGLDEPGDEARRQQEEDQEVASDEAQQDVIPAPDSEADDERRRPVRLTRVDVSPPWWASTLAVIGFFGGPALMIVSASEENPVPFAAGATAAVIGTGGGIYLLGRNWRSSMPTIDSRAQQDQLSGGQPAQTSQLLFRWSTSF